MPELGLTAVFILMFLLDLFLPAPQASLVTPHGMYPADHSTLSKPIAGRDDFIWRYVSLNPYGVCSEKIILTIGTILVFLQADTWLKREDTRHKQGEFTSLPSVPCWVCISW